MQYEIAFLNVSNNNEIGKTMKLVKFIFYQHNQNFVSIKVLLEI